jgi:hypothetical protein
VRKDGVVQVIINKSKGNRMLDDERQSTDCISRDLKEWHVRWLMKGDTVQCRYCFAAQQISDSAHPLSHKVGCPLGAGYMQYPWQALKLTLSKIPSKM